MNNARTVRDLIDILSKYPENYLVIGEFSGHISSVKIEHPKAIHGEVEIESRILHICEDKKVEVALIQIEERKEFSFAILEPCEHYICYL